MLGTIDRTLKPEKVQLYLCKPDKSIMFELYEAYGVELKTSYNGIHQLNFSIPYYVMIKQKKTVNSHFNQILGDLLILYKKGTVSEYFVISGINATGSDKTDKAIEAYLLPYSLRKKLVQQYKDTKMLYDPIGNDGFLNDTLVSNTTWTVAHIDDELAALYRTVDITQQSIIQFIDTLNQAFDSVSVWDTNAQTVSFYTQNNFGQDRGLTIEYGKYLKTLSAQTNMDNVTTRLYVYGKNNITFNNYNPAGTEYIDDYSYYIYPFQRDENKNVISHSNYMSDSLCHALLDYSDVLTAQGDSFSTLIDQLSTEQTDLTALQNDMNQLQSDMSIIQNNLDVANSLGNDITDLISQKSSKQAEIDSKQTEINAKQAEIDATNAQITAVKNIVAVENNFTQEQFDELSFYINEKVENNDYILDDKELWDYAKGEIVKINQPIINYTVDIVDFTKVVQAQKDWDKLNYGDIVTVYYPQFNVNIQARIISITHNEDNRTIQMEIANSSDINNGFLQFKDLYSAVNTTSLAVTVGKPDWDKSIQNTTQLNGILNNAWDATKNAIKAGVNESVEIGKRGIIIKSPDTPDDMLIAQAGVLAISNDGGDTWKNAVTDKGIVAEQLIGKIIAGQNLTIQNTSGKYSIDENGMTVDGGSFKIINTSSASNTDLSNGLTGNDVQKAISDYNTNNNQISDTPNDPVLATDGSCIDHTVNSDGTINISFEWTFDSTGNKGNIDGFLVYIFQGASSSPYSFGTSPSVERIFNATPEKTAFIIYNVPANNYYTFGVQAYRMVDTSVNNSGLITSNLVKSTVQKEDPYSSSQNISYSGDITETIAGTDFSSSVMKLGASYNNVKIDTSGFTVTTNNNTSRTIMNGTDGIKIQSSTNNGVTWTDDFYVDTSGNLNLTGNITATAGYIGGTSGFTITQGKIYSGTKTGFNSTDNGVYVGTDGIGLGAGNFYVDSDGNLTATNANITGTITMLPGSSLSGDSITGGTITGAAWKSDSTGDPFKIYIGNSPTPAATFYASNLTLPGSLTVSGISSGSPIDSGTSGTSGKFRYASSTNTYLEVASSSSTIYVAGSNIAVFSSVAATINGSMTVKGTINGTTVGTSDRNLKRDINSYHDVALAKIVNTPVYTFNYKTDDYNEPPRIGIMAQESPSEIVIDSLTDELGNDYMGVNIYSMLSLMWKAIQELAAQNDFLNNKINSR